MLSKPQGLVRQEWLGKFKNSPHRESNPRPSGLYHSALTTTIPCAPLQIEGFFINEMDVSLCYRKASKFSISIGNVSLRSSVTAVIIDSTGDFLPVAETTACFEDSRRWHSCHVSSVEATAAERSSFSPPLTLSSYLAGFSTAACVSQRYWCSVNSLNPIFLPQDVEESILEMFYTVTCGTAREMCQ
jgi:hypothetical protein